MPKLKAPVTEATISKQIGRKIKSPIFVASLNDLKLPSNEFLEYMSPLFAALPWDPYDVRRLQVELLIRAFPKDKAILESRFKDYFLGKKDKRSYRKWISQLKRKDRKSFEEIKPWRRRSVAQFLLKETKRGISVKREKVPQFVQEVGEDDFRSLPRVFVESPAAHVEHDLFYDFLKEVFKLVQKKWKKKAVKVSMTAHFMSVQAIQDKPGDNSPEGAHEDGADFIISALVINRINLKGGQTQIIELRPNGKKEIIYRHTLQPGEFVFQADTRDEIIYGTDLWHHVTPFYIKDPKSGEAWRDIIGLDINVIEDK